MKKISFFLFLSVFYCLKLHAQYLYKAVTYYPGSNYTTNGTFVVFKHKLHWFTWDQAAASLLCTFDTTGNWNKPPQLPYFQGSDVYGKYAIIGDTLYMAGSVDNKEFELYKFDGLNTISLAADILPGPGSSNPLHLIAFNSKLYFEADMPGYGKELWEYDPASKSKKLISDTWPGTNDGYASYMTVFNNKLYFSARDASGIFNVHSYDPITGAVKKCSNITAGTYFDAQPRNYKVIGAKMYFLGSTTTDLALFSIDVNDVVTMLTTGVICADYVGMGDASGYGVLNNKIHFITSDGKFGQDLSSYDIVSGVKNKIAHLNNMPSFYPSNADYHFITYKNKLYFNGDDSTHGVELWEYDGINMPKIIKDNNAGLGSSHPYCFTLFNNKLFFSGQQSTGVFELHVFGDTPGVATTIKRSGFEGDVKVYPNPAHVNAVLELTLKTATDYSLLVTDVTGRIVYSADKQQFAAGTSKIIIPMANMAASTYYYTLLDADNKACVSGQILKE